MECEICGREIYGKTFRAVVDGAKLLVCSECAQFASSSWKPETRKPTPPVQKNLPPTIRPQIVRRPSPTASMDEVELVEDYSQRVRKGRERLSLTHEELSRKIGERVSVLQKLETGKMTPDQALAKKLEHTLKIKLLEAPLKITSVDKSYVKNNYGLTLGDIVIIQKPKSDVEEEERGQ